MKKYLAVFFSVLILVSMVAFPNVVLAEDAATDSFDFTRFDNKGLADTDNAARKVVQIAVTVIRIVATGISVIMLTYIGIKYMSAAPEQRAEFKRSAAVYIVGAMLVFGAQGILGLIAQFVEDNLS